MPEGDVVWRTAHRLDRALTGQVLTVCDLRWPQLAMVDLTGQTVTGVVSRGKHLLLRTDAGLTLHSHLRMDGAWHVFEPGAATAISSGRTPRHAPRPNSDLRALVGNASWLCAGYRLGMLDLVRTESEPSLVGHLGPDLMDPSWDRRAADRALAADPRRPVGEALLDQRVAAGIGTFYLAETCFLGGVSPWQPVGEVRDPFRLVERAAALLQANRERVPQTTTGSTRRGENAYVYGRTGRPCRRCGTTIEAGAIGVAPQQRTTYRCPHCQPGTGPQQGPVPDSDDS